MHIERTTPESLRTLKTVEVDVNGFYGFNLLQSKENSKVFALSYKGHITKGLTKGATLKMGESFRKAVDILNTQLKKAA